MVKQPHNVADEPDKGTVLEPLGGASYYAQVNTRKTEFESPVPQYASDFQPLAVAPPDSSLDSYYKPTRRALVPLLTILDDGNPTAGEVIRIREPVTVIGRTEGHVKIQNDFQVSTRHAELVRESTPSSYRWLLRDLQSANGTFVRCTKALLRPDRIIILGSRRFRFQPAVQMIDQNEPGTYLIDNQHSPQLLWPALIETASHSTAMEIRLRGSSNLIGRPGCGNDVELDDPLIASQHAIISQTSGGEWRIEAKPSKNGLWIQVTAIALVGTCRFQCGEQRFLFEE